MFHLLYRSRIAAARGRALATVAVLAVAAALVVALLSRPDRRRPGAADAALRAVVAQPVEAAERRLGSDVDAFTGLAQRLAQERQRRAQEMLDRLYPGRAFVTVGVELDPRWEHVSEKVQPDMPAVVEDERLEADGTRRRVLEPFAGTRETEMLAPDVRQVSVALVLDESIAGDRSKRDAIVEAVKKAVGPARGRDPDVEVLVDRLPSAAATPQTPVQAGSPLAFLDARIAGWSAVIALAALALAWHRLRRSAGARRAEAVEVAAPVPGEIPVGLRREVERAIDDDPLGVSRLLEGWLSERRP